MKHTTLLGLAVSAAFASTAAVAAPSAHVYGDLDASFNYTDIADNGSGGDDSRTDFESFESKVGITGGDQLRDGWRAFYRAEFGFSVTDSSSLGSTNQERYLGLANERFGKVRIGTISAPHDDVVNVTDVFNNLHAVQQYALLTRLRLENTARYDSPAIGGGLKFAVSLTADGTANSSVNTTPGAGLYVPNCCGTDKEELDIANVAVWYDAGQFTVGGSYMTFSNSDGGDDLSQSLFGVAAAFNLNNIQLGLNYEQFSDDGTDNDTTNISASGVFSTGQFDFLAGVAVKTLETAGEDRDRTNLSFGVHYNQSDRTQSYIELARRTTEIGTADDQEINWLNVGVRHHFGNAKR